MTPTVRPGHPGGTGTPGIRSIARRPSIRRAQERGVNPGSTPELKQERVIAMMKMVSSVNQAIGTMNIGMRVRLLVVLITQMPDAEVEKLRGTLNTNRFSATPVEIDIRLLDFEKLQRIYVTDQF